MRHHQALLVVLFAAGCSAPRFEVTPSLGLSRLSGDFAIASGSVASANDVEDLGLDDSEATPGARVDLEWGSPHLSISLARLSTSGTGRTSADLSQGSTTITAGTAVDSDFDFTYGNAVVTFDLVPTDAFELGLGFGLQGLSLQTEVSPVGLGAGVDTDEDLPVPVLALRAGAAFGPIAVDGLLSGIALDYDGDQVTTYDLDLRARWKMSEHAHLLLGYRRWMIDLEYEDGGDQAELDLTVDGPYLGVAFAF